jgi:hypothetical protein
MNKQARRSLPRAGTERRCCQLRGCQAPQLPVSRWSGGTGHATAPGSASMISSARSRDPPTSRCSPRVGADLERPQHRDLHVTILPGSG